MVHKLGVGLGIVLIVVGIVLIGIALAIPLVNLQKPQLLLVGVSKTPLMPASGAVVLYQEYGPVVNLTIPPVPPLPTPTIGLLFNKTLVTGIDGRTPTVYLWVTKQPTVYNFTVVLTVLKAQGIELKGYTFVLKPITNTVQTSVLQNGATAMCEFTGVWLGQSTCTIYLPGTEVTFIPMGVGNGELSMIESVISSGSSVVGFDMVAVPQSPDQQSVGFNYMLGVPVMGREITWTFDVEVPAGMHYTYYVMLPLIGYFIPGWGYYPIANAVLLGIGLFLVILGIAVLGIEYHWWRRMRIFKAYGIPP